MGTKTNPFPNTALSSLTNAVPTVFLSTNKVHVQLQCVKGNVQLQWRHKSNPKGLLLL